MPAFSNHQIDYDQLNSTHDSSTHRPHVCDIHHPSTQLVGRLDQTHSARRGGAMQQQQQRRP